MYYIISSISIVRGVQGLISGSYHFPIRIYFFLKRIVISLVSDVDVVEDFFRDIVILNL